MVLRLAAAVSDLFSASTLRKGGSTMINQGIVSAANFLTGILIGRFCTKEEFGLYMLGCSIVLLVMDLQISLISTPYMVFSPRLRDNALKLYNGSSLAHQIVLTALIVLLLSAGAVFLSFGHGPDGLQPVVFTLSAAIGFIMLREFIRRICFAGLRMESAFLLDACVAVLQLIGLIVLTRMGLLSATRAYWVIGLACGSAGIVWLIQNRSKFKLQKERAIFDLKSNWKFGKWVFSSGVLWAISTNLYPWFLSYFHGTAAAGEWAACMGVMALVNVPLAGLQNFIGPKISNAYAEGGTAGMGRLVIKTSAFLLVMMSLLVCVLFIAGDPMLSLFYGAKYEGSGLVVTVLALGVVAAASAFSFSRALFAMERADIDFKVNFVSLLMLFAFGIWLVRPFGPLGAAAGLLLANVAASGVRCAVFVAISRPSSER